MTLIACPQCSKQYEEEDLFCPHCGTASIPQLSKAQLRLEFMKASKGALAFIYLGLALGLLAGGVYFVITLLNGTADFVSVCCASTHAPTTAAVGAASVRCN